VRGFGTGSFGRRLADWLEVFFGPDPGLARLHAAARGIASAALGVTAVISLFGASMRYAPALAVVFFLGVLGNVALRDKGRGRQAGTLALMGLTLSTAIGTIGALSPLGWPADAAVILVATVATYAQSLGPRYGTVGVAAFIGSFIGAVLHPALAVMPVVFAAAAISAAITALLRFVLFAPDPARILRRVRTHLFRRAGRIVHLVREMLSDAAGSDDPDGEQGLEHRAHRELGRLNDAFMIAQNELQDMAGPPDGEGALSWDHFFALELAAERLLRAAAENGASPQRERALEELGRLDRALLQGQPPDQPQPRDDAGDPLLVSIRRLEEALAASARRGRNAERPAT